MQARDDRVEREGEEEENRVGEDQGHELVAPIPCDPSPREAVDRTGGSRAVEPALDHVEMIALDHGLAYHLEHQEVSGIIGSQQPLLDLPVDLAPVVACHLLGRENRGHLRTAVHPGARIAGEQGDRESLEIAILRPTVDHDLRMLTGENVEQRLLCSDAHRYPCRRLEQLVTTGHPRVLEQGGHDQTCQWELPVERAPGQALLALQVGAQSLDPKGPVSALGGRHLRGREGPLRGVELAMAFGQHVEQSDLLDSDPVERLRLRERSLDLRSGTGFAGRLSESHRRRKRDQGGEDEPESRARALTRHGASRTIQENRCSDSDLPTLSVCAGRPEDTGGRPLLPGLRAEEQVLQPVPMPAEQVEVGQPHQNGDQPGTAKADRVRDHHDVGDEWGSRAPRPARWCAGSPAAGRR